MIFPGDDTFPQSRLAREQMNGACGLFTFTLKGGSLASITRFCEGLRHITMAVSCGGHESLILPKCAGINPEHFNPENIDHQYIRMYTGLEDPAYIIEDIRQALSKL